MLAALLVAPAPVGGAAAQLRALTHADVCCETMQTRLEALYSPKGVRRPRHAVQSGVPSRARRLKLQLEVEVSEARLIRTFASNGVSYVHNVRMLPTAAFVTTLLYNNLLKVRH
jgi:hypothetical protein